MIKTRRTKAKLDGYVCIHDPALDVLAMKAKGTWSDYMNDPERKDLIILREGETPTIWKLRCILGEEKRGAEIAVDNSYLKHGVYATGMARQNLLHEEIFKLGVVSAKNVFELGDEYPADSVGLSRLWDEKLGDPVVDEDTIRDVGATILQLSRGTNKNGSEKTEAAGSTEEKEVEADLGKSP